MVAFFNPRKDDAAKLMHRRTFHTSVSTLQRMCGAKAAGGLEQLSSSKHVDSVCEAYLKVKAANMTHKRH